MSETEKEMFRELMALCRKYHATIYSDNDGNVWVCQRNTHYRMHMVSAGNCHNLERVTFERLEEKEEGK